MPDHQPNEPTRKDQVFITLRREVLAARLKITLDEQLGRETSPTVIRLSKMKLPPIARTYDPTSKEQVFATLRREILAARLKVTLDEQLGRETSPRVKLLAQMKLPPIARPRGRGDSQAKPAWPATSSE